MIEVEKSDYVDVEKSKFEVVERKGLGHPDSLTDAIAALMSIIYSKNTLEEYGRILHHNIDKVAIAGGTSNPKFGGGEIVEPAEVLFIGRAIIKMNGNPINVYDMAKKSVETISINNVGENFKPNFSTNWIKRGSVDLISNFEKNTPLANDTSFATSWAPYSKMELLALNIEKYLNSLKTKQPFIGTDIKVMVRRINDEINVNIALAFIDKYVENRIDYNQKKEYIRSLVSQEFEILEKNLHLNTADGEKENEAYLTVTGTSTECGDDGQVGRGNRITGVIAPGRPNTLEATAGKNPNRHVGNFYNVWATIIARKIWEEMGVKNNVKLVSTLGKPITECDAMIQTEYEADKKRVNEIVESVVENYEKITEDIINKKVDMYPFNMIKSK